MGTTWSSSGFFTSSPSPTELSVQDVLALCEDGDLLLAREKLADSALRLGVDFVVARDIQRMQHGQFPAQRVTSLPPWTSCELLLRHEGALHVVVVSASGVQLAPFEQRITMKLPQSQDRFAIRRLQHNVRTEPLSNTLRDLATQVATVSPLSWRALLTPSAAGSVSPRSSRSMPVDRKTATAAMEVLPPLVRLLLWRMMELFGESIDPNSISTTQDTKTVNNLQDAALPLHLEQTPTKAARTPRTNGSDEVRTTTTEDVTINEIWRLALETLGVAEVTARLSAAFTAAVYERVRIVQPIATNKRESLTPAAFWTRTNIHERVVLCPSTALGDEMVVAARNKT